MAAEKSPSKAVAIAPPKAAPPGPFLDDVVMAVAAEPDAFRSSVISAQSLKDRSSRTLLVREGDAWHFISLEAMAAYLAGVYRTAPQKFLEQQPRAYLRQMGYLGTGARTQANGPGANGAGRMELNTTTLKSILGISDHGFMKLKGQLGTGMFRKVGTSVAVDITRLEPELRRIGLADDARMEELRAAARDYMDRAKEKIATPFRGSFTKRDEGPNKYAAARQQAAQAATPPAGGMDLGLEYITQQALRRDSVHMAAVRQGGLVKIDNRWHFPSAGALIGFLNSRRADFASAKYDALLSQAKAALVEQIKSGREKRDGNAETTAPGKERYAR